MATPAAETSLPAAIASKLLKFMSLTPKAHLGNTTAIPSTPPRAAYPSSFYPHPVFPAKSHGNRRIPTDPPTRP